MAGRPIIIPTTSGRFECPHCGMAWVGTWRGDPKSITCVRCEKPIFTEVVRGGE